MSQPNTPSPEINPNSTPSISSAAHTYQLAMQTQSSSTPPSSTPSGVLQMPGATRDVVMEDAPLQRPAVCLTPPQTLILHLSLHLLLPPPTPHPAVLQIQLDVPSRACLLH